MTIINHPPNINFLSPHGFEFVTSNLPNTIFYVQDVKMPALNLDVVTQGSPFKQIPRPGDKLHFGDLTLTFKIDEQMKNYQEIQNWMEGLGFPDNYDQYNELLRTGSEVIDGQLIILNSKMNPEVSISFINIFPYKLDGFSMNSNTPELNFLTASVTFKIQEFLIKKLK